MTAPDRECRIGGCETRHSRSLFCCRRHWYALPKSMRDAIWNAFLGDGVFSAEYLQAAENAEAFLEDRDARDMGGVLDRLPLAVLSGARRAQAVLPDPAAGVRGTRDRHVRVDGRQGGVDAPRAGL
jgi:hypothetical protein